MFQLVLQSAGAGPSVLQQLCTLPFPFYGDPRLLPYTLPALLAATHNNSEAMAILSCEMSYEVSGNYKYATRIRERKRERDNIKKYKYILIKKFHIK